MHLLRWTNPHGIDVSSGFIYYIRVVDNTGAEYRYVGKARNGARLNEYVRNISKISRGLPRGTKQKYRAVHLALSKAHEYGWQYEIFPIESAESNTLLIRERHQRLERQCNLNGARTWQIGEYPELSIQHLLR